ncbi:unnamed protein product [Ambrosiozyma monospora]|uniref:2-dehydropantolactone reductase n=1 Tax=Ambrosiozyma monospora TaxID=43982 RepID=A0A9W6YL94_AMBMO|nr:unnamed protein product [Ambrosiozyma monospora]
MSKSIKLNNGTTIPFMGLGTWEILHNCPSVVQTALDKGYRMIDTATLYGNERECGQGIIQWLKADPVKNKREDVYYITKLWHQEHGYDNAKAAIKKCLQKVEGLGYIDLLLIHSPCQGKAARLGTWKAMQEAVDDGLVKSIGVSNYGKDHILELLNWSGLKIKPVVNEIEVHPWCMRQELCDFCKSKDIAVIAFAPLSHAGRVNDKSTVEVAKRNRITNGQALIRWSVQKGYIPIPKTKTISRLSENLDVLSFNLSDSDVKTLEHPNVHDPSDWEVTTVP